MKKLLYVLAAGVLISCQTQSENTDMQTDNPFYQEWDTPYGVPPFGQIKNKHYSPAFEDGMAQHLKEVEAIAGNPDAPTFDNTIEAFEKSGDLLNKVSNVFFTLTGAHTNDSIQAIQKEISPLLSAHNDNIFLNSNFFDRVKALYEDRENLVLTIEQNKLLENYYNRFIRSGAALDKEQKARMREINERISVLQVQFGENVLKEENKFELLLEEDQLDGLPENVKTAGAEAAAEKGYEGKYLFTTHRPSLYPFITYSENRELRKQLKMGYIMRGDNGGELDNKEILREIVNLRLEKANMLGFDTHADYALQDRMLNTPDKVYDLLDKVWPAAIEAAKKERDLMKAMSVEEGLDIDIMPWDWWYYAEKIKVRDYSLDESEISPYLMVDNVINGSFILANKLFGLTFEEQTNIPKYHPDVRTYTVKNENGELVGIYLSDWFYRSSKRGGAWMSNIREQSNMDGNEVIPIIYNVGNFNKPTADKPSLLSMDQALTLFHEFGHALHGLLSECTYPSISGTATPRDFVEFPSQVMENWVFEPEMLAQYAFHYETGEVMPDDLVQKIRKAGTFNQGFGTVEYMAASYLDMAYHTITEPLAMDINQFEDAAMNEIGLIDAIVPRYRSTYFRHITGGYSAGYYSYLNSEIMDADAFAAFKENGLFDETTANAFREHILSRGGTMDAMEMYVNFRGRKPSYEGLLERRGFN
ncbi:M3 family metallopeptidase [Ekhidna sp. MALMAid0563]|uniref:M3 family metallopeptidase n=1 Tax=Ekhidna sp. MALMAid0563 TaxID=3143937 RepID=UPI0032DED5B8